jgi:hypothetical protein
MVTYPRPRLLTVCSARAGAQKRCWRSPESPPDTRKDADAGSRSPAPLPDKPAHLPGKMVGETIRRAHSVHFVHCGFWEPSLAPRGSRGPCRRGATLKCVVLRAPGREPRRPAERSRTHPRSATDWQALVSCRNGLLVKLAGTHPEGSGEPRNACERHVGHAAGLQRTGIRIPLVSRASTLRLVNSTAEGPNCPLCPPARVGAQCGARELSCHNHAVSRSWRTALPYARTEGSAVAPSVCHGSPATRPSAPHGAWPGSR